MAPATVLGNCCQPGSCGLIGWPRSSRPRLASWPIRKRRIGGAGDGVGDLAGEGLPAPVRGVRPARDGRDAGEQQAAAHVLREIVQGQVRGGIQVDQRRVVAAGGQAQGGDQPAVRAAGPGAREQPDTGIGGLARQRAQRQGERGRVVGLIDRVHHDRERLPPLQQRVDQAIQISLRCPGRGGQRAHDLPGRGGAGVDRDIDDTRRQASERVTGG